MSDLARFIEKLPKAELHVHIEGTLEPELLFALAERNGLTLPYPSVDAVRSAYNFQNLQGFLDLYYQGMAVLCTEQDFYDLAMEYLARAQAQAVRHVEMFFDAQAHTRRGVPFESVVDGLHRAALDAETCFGMTVRLILCFLRDRPPAEAAETLQCALAHRDRIIGIGLDSAERDYPPARFADVFADARGAGFRIVAHAGEEGPADYIRDAVDLLRTERIDHGIRALEDDDLTQRLADARLPLTVCPLSNVRLRAVENIHQHPLPELMARGLVVTIHSDDPAYFGGYINDNYLAAAQAFGWDLDTIAGLARASFEAAFLDSETKTAYVQEVDDYRRSWS